MDVVTTWGVWLPSKPSLLRAPRNPACHACGTLPGFSRHPSRISRDRGVIGVSLIQQVGTEARAMEMEPGLLPASPGTIISMEQGFYPSIFIYHSTSSFLTWTFGIAAPAGGWNCEVKPAPKWERNGKLNSNHVRKMPLRNALGFGVWGSMALQHPRNSPVHAELRQAKHQAPVTGDLDEQEQTSKLFTVLWKSPPC